MTILTINAGSSSLKVTAFRTDTALEVLTHHAIENIGSDTTPTMAAALDELTEWLEHEPSLANTSVDAFGFRVVHGGATHTGPKVLSDTLVQELTELTSLAPNHMPGTLQVVNHFRTAFPNATHVACFDTAFFANIPDVAKTLPIPHSLQTDTPLRRYGFHGLAYEGLLEDFQAHEGELAANGKVIMTHLGSGASLTACENGKPIDMTMGFTPVSGIMMSTRSGDLEPGVFTYLQSQLGLSADATNEILTHQSGLLGVSGLSEDMYTLLQAQTSNPQAALAVELFCTQITKTIGAYSALLGGVNSIIFSGGIGERSAEIRQRILQNLAFLGIEVDSHRNTQNERLISSDHSRVGVHVIPAQEAMTIATQTLKTIEHKETT